MILFRIRIILFSLFRMRILFRTLHNILENFFTFVFLPCQCVRLGTHSNKIQAFSGNLFLYNKEVFLNWAFLLRNCQILPVFQNNFTKIHFGSGTIFSDPAKSLRSDRNRIQIHNTGCINPCKERKYPSSKKIIFKTSNKTICDKKKEIQRPQKYSRRSSSRSRNSELRLRTVLCPAFLDTVYSGRRQMNITWKK
jgi:hypothetical protein